MIFHIKIMHEHWPGDLEKLIWFYRFIIVASKDNSDIFIRDVGNFSLLLAGHSLEG